MSVRDFNVYPLFPITASSSLVADTKPPVNEAEDQTIISRGPQGESTIVEPATAMIEVTQDLPTGPPMVCRYDYLPTVRQPAFCPPIEESQEDILRCVEGTVKEVTVKPSSDAKEPTDVPHHNDAQSCNNENEGMKMNESQPSQEGAQPLIMEETNQNMEEDKPSKKKKVYTPTQMRTRKKDLYNKRIFE